MTTLARHFGDELIAAGLNDGIAWGYDGTILGRENLTEAQNTALDALIAAHDPENPPAKPVITAKADLWRRLTEAEAEAVDAVLSNPELTPIRLRRIFEAAQYIDSSDPDYPALRAGLVAAIGEERADEVLSG